MSVPTALDSPRSTVLCQLPVSVSSAVYDHWTLATGAPTHQNSVLNSLLGYIGETRSRTVLKCMPFPSLLLENSPASLASPSILPFPFPSVPDDLFQDARSHFSARNILKSQPNTSEGLILVHRSRLKKDASYYRAVHAQRGLRRAKP